MNRSSWQVVETGVNGKPFLWKNSTDGTYVMIDIFTAHPEGCYTVMILNSNPLVTEDVKGEIIGMGCANTRTDWVEAYEKARKIADQYMDLH